MHGNISKRKIIFELVEIITEHLMKHEIQSLEPLHIYFQKHIIEIILHIYKLSIIRYMVFVKVRKV